MNRRTCGHCPWSIGRSLPSLAAGIPGPARQVLKRGDTCRRQLSSAVALPLIVYPHPEFAPIARDEPLWDAGMALSLEVPLQLQEAARPTPTGPIRGLAGGVPEPTGQAFERGDACRRQQSPAVALPLIVHPDPEPEPIVRDELLRDAGMALSLEVLLQLPEAARPTSTRSIRGFAAGVPDPTRQAFERGDACWRHLSPVVAFPLIPHPHSEFEPIVRDELLRDAGMALSLEVLYQLREAACPTSTRSIRGFAAGVPDPPGRLSSAAMRAFASSALR
jgi:hypothetical protein